jgi:hypothetical protein
MRKRRVDAQVEQIIHKCKRRNGGERLGKAPKVQARRVSA